MANPEGGCLCGEIRYATAEEPFRVTFCHCRFCQRATGAAYMVEPVFERKDFAVLKGTPKVYRHTSAGSGKVLEINFCPTCGTKLFLAFERFPELIGVYGGTLDDPNGFPVRADNAKHIFLSAARHDTIIPPGLDAFDQYATELDGTPREPTVYDRPHTIGA